MKINRFRQILKEELENYKKLHYIGNCIEADDIEFCPLFSSAAEMAYYVGDPDNGDYGNSIEITKQHFDKISNNIPSEIDLKDAMYFYIEDKNSTNYNNARYFYILDNNGIHWFFER